MFAPTLESFVPLCIHILGEDEQTAAFRYDAVLFLAICTKVQSWRLCVCLLMLRRDRLACRLACFESASRGPSSSPTRAQLVAWSRVQQNLTHARSLTLCGGFPLSSSGISERVTWCWFSTTRSRGHGWGGSKLRWEKQGWPALVDRTPTLLRFL